MAQNDFDVIVIGAGPGGYVAAIRCAQLGLKTACVDRWLDSSGVPSLGGTCLNVGCIPSKALLDSSERFEQIAHHSAEHGIKAGSVSIDVPQMQVRKKKLVRELTGGIGALFKANKITQLIGHGTLMKPGTVKITAADDTNQTLTASHIILASGSIPVALPAMPIDNERVFDSSGALAFDAVPQSLGIIGAGVIGLELGSVWRRLGAKVTIIEAQDDLLPSADPMIAREAKKQFAKQGLDIRLGCQVTKVAAGPDDCVIEYRSNDGPHTLTVEKLVVAVGRRPFAEGLLDPNCGLAPNERGGIDVNDHCETALSGVWAIGDLVRGPMLAHKASEEGIAVAERIATGIGHVDHTLVPWVIYTHPEIAWVGATETELKAQGIGYTTGVFPFAASGRAKAVGQTEGFIKILAHRDTDRILGVHMIGAQTSELINEATFAIAMEASAEDLARTVHAHPTLAEVVHEAALANGGRAIHKANRQ